MTLSKALLQLQWRLSDDDKECRNM